ncbi:MAG: formate dehydrogenase accessory protein FdhE [Candidatus Rokubacteria bacterium]|nr:formate dehydrogenase accessory protein FdhE [Candidatus Rokubacteria bacterium]
MTVANLAEEWAELLARRPEFRETLAVYGELIACWAGWPADRPTAGPWSAAACRGSWERGVPLLAESRPALGADDLEETLGLAMEQLASVREDLVPALRRLAEAWDRGALGPAAFFPERGRVGSPAVGELSGLPEDAVAFLAHATLRPALERHFAPARGHLDAHVWALGVCPFCGDPPGFSDVLEDGQRRLACHLCGGGWPFARVRCPFCGTEQSGELTRLEPEERDQGYVIIGCGRCRAYLKELDRRVRWNGQSALVEDWGSPHLDLVAVRAGYWRPVPSLVQLARLA